MVLVSAGIKSWCGYIFSAAFLVVGAVVLTLYGSGIFDADRPQSSNRELEADMQPLPRMTLSDAVKRCELEAQVKFGDQLLRTFPDWHSSRFEPKRSIYLVMLSADVGRLDLFQTANVYCYVDPVDRDVDYYRVAGLKSRSIFSLKKLKDIFD